LKAIELVDKNYALKAKVLEAEAQYAESQAQIASVLAELERYKQLNSSSSPTPPNRFLQETTDLSGRDHSDNRGRSASSSYDDDRSDNSENSDSDDSASSNTDDNSDGGTEEEREESVDSDRMTDNDASSQRRFEDDGNDDNSYNESEEEDSGRKLMHGGSDTYSLYRCEPALSEGNEWDKANRNDELLTEFMALFFDNCQKSYWSYAQRLHKERSINPTALCSVDQWRRGKSSCEGDVFASTGAPNEFFPHDRNHDMISATDSFEYRQGFLGYIRTESEDTLSEIDLGALKSSSGQVFPKSISAYPMQRDTTNSTTPASSISEITISNAQSTPAHPAPQYFSPPSSLTQEPSPRKSDGSKLQCGRGAAQ
jgi:hypothetical protein